MTVDNRVHVTYCLFCQTTFDRGVENSNLFPNEGDFRMRNSTLLILLMAVILPLSFASATDVLSIGRYDGYIGEEITVQVTIDNSSVVDRFGFRFNFPNSLLEYDSFSAGDLTGSFDELNCTAYSTYLYISGRDSTGIPANSDGTIIEFQMTVLGQYLPPKSGYFKITDMIDDIANFDAEEGKFDLVTRTILVPGDAATIQAGIDLAHHGDTVQLVNSGTANKYTGTGNKNLDFDGKRITLKGYNHPAAQTFIDCQNSGRFINFADSETSSTIVQDMVIQNGSITSGNGGAILIGSGCSPKLRNIDISSCEADAGGAIYMSQYCSADLYDVNATLCSADMGGGFFIGYCSPTLTDCGLSYCEATATSGANSGGGGIKVIGNWYVSATPTIESCTIESCEAETYGAGIYYAYGTGGTLCDTTLKNNEANSGYGGAISSYDNSSNDLLISGCSIYGNDAGYGGGVSLQSGRCEIADTIFYNNGSTSTYGGGLYFNTTEDPYITNCAIIDNTAYEGAGIFLQNTDEYTYIYNCTFACNTTSNSNQTGCIHSEDGNSNAYFGFCAFHDSNNDNFWNWPTVTYLNCIADDWTNCGGNKTNCDTDTPDYDNTTSLCSYISSFNNLYNALYQVQSSSNPAYNYAGSVSSIYWTTCVGTEYISERSTDENGNCDTNAVDVGFHYNNCQ